MNNDDASKNCCVTICEGVIATPNVESMMQDEFKAANHKVGAARQIMQVL